VIVGAIWIIRILVILMILRMVVRAFSPSRPAPIRSGGRGKQVERTGGTLVRDPECGTYIPEARAITVGSGRDALHFCSRECQEKYQRRV
jgi:hypothetical protein